MSDSVERQDARKNGIKKGRPMDRSRDAVILGATLELLAEHGYDRLTMDMVAERARAGKGALYRRWSSKASLVVDALALESPGLPEPDTGTLLGDLEMLLAHLRPSGEDYLRTGIVAGLATACSRDPELVRALREKLLGADLAVARRVLERAVRRGEIPRERDLDLIIEIIPALFLSHVLTSGNPPDTAFIRRIVKEIIYPLAISPVPTNSGE